MAAQIDTHKLSRQIAGQVERGDWKAIEDHFNETPFVQHMGLSISLENPDIPNCFIREPMPFHTGGVGQNFLNGAVIAAMFDFVIGLTALHYASRGNFATTNVNVKFVRPVKQIGVYVVAEVTREIGRKLFVESTLFDGEDKPCCYASGEIRTGIK